MGYTNGERRGAERTSQSNDACSADDAYQHGLRDEAWRPVHSEAARPVMRRDVDHRDAATPRDLPPRSDLERARAALRLALAADLCLKSGDDEALVALGFSLEHIASLRATPRGARAGYPPYSLKNLKATVRWLESAQADAGTTATA